MKIFSGLGRSPQRLQTRDAEAGGLKKADIVSDIFNNQASPSEEERVEVKLRLSNTSKRLGQELADSVKGFLKEHPRIQENLENFSIDGLEESRVDSSKLQVRKMRVYLNWLQLREGSPQEEISSSEELFYAIHEEGEDETMQGLFDQYNIQRKKYQAEQKKAQPSYYYMAFPEAYSFN